MIAVHDQLCRPADADGVQAIQDGKTGVLFEGNTQIAFVMIHSRGNVIQPQILLIMGFQIANHAPGQFPEGRSIYILETIRFLQPILLRDGAQQRGHIHRCRFIRQTAQQGVFLYNLPEQAADQGAVRYPQGNGIGCGEFDLQIVNGFRGFVGIAVLGVGRDQNALPLLQTVALTACHHTADAGFNVEHVIVGVRMGFDTALRCYAGPGHPQKLKLFHKHSPLTFLLIIP